MVKLKWKGTEIMEALGKVYGINSSKKISVYKWVQRFREGREELEDDALTGRPTSSKSQENMQAVQNLIENVFGKVKDIFSLDQESISDSYLANPFWSQV